MAEEIKIFEVIHSCQANHDHILSSTDKLSANHGPKAEVNFNMVHISKTRTNESLQSHSNPYRRRQLLEKTHNLL